VKQHELPKKVKRTYFNYDLKCNSRLLTSGICQVTFLCSSGVTPIADKRNINPSKNLISPWKEREVSLSEAVTQDERILYKWATDEKDKDQE